MEFQERLLTVNQELLLNGTKFRIEQRGCRLNLRGPLPSRDSSNKFNTQRISLGITANQEGLKEAQKILELVLFQIKHNQFNWKHWTKSEKRIEIRNKDKNLTGEINHFKQAFFLDPIRRKSPSGAKSTWRSAYWPYLRRLFNQANQLDKELDVSLLMHTLKSYSENSRSRQQCGTVLAALARHLDLTLPEEWKAQASGYGLHKAHFRNLPSDEVIRKIFWQIPNPKWRLVYGLMATYGLRNHEVFYCDLSCFKNQGDKVLRVLPNTKTGEHQVWPFHPEWVELFHLHKLGIENEALPKINLDLNRTTLQTVGKRVAEQFRRYKLPITPYDLRHAWAIRTIHIGLPDTVSARMMGHSVSIHTRTYHHWITRRDQQKAVDAALKNQAT